MTLSDKKIEDFRNNFIIKIDEELIFGRKNPFESFKTWLKQTIAEAEANKFKEGQKSAYLNCRKILRNNDNSVSWKKIREKITELEVVKCK